MNDQTTDCTWRGAPYSTLTFSFLAGGIAGAAVALLLAPQSGKLTRATLGRKLNDGAEAARDLKGRVVETFHDATDSARDMKDRAVRRGQDIRAEATYRVEGAAAALAGKPGPKEPGNGDPKKGVGI